MYFEKGVLKWLGFVVNRVLEVCKTNLQQAPPTRVRKYLEK